MDAQDPLRHLRDAFILSPDEVYLDGNSLGVPTHAAQEELLRAARDEWAGQLIRSWNGAGWFDLPVELGGRDGPEPVRYGDWEKKGIAVDF